MAQFARAAFVLLALSHALYAQTTTGRIVGTVIDESGATVPRADIRVTHLETNTIRVTATDESGSYSVPNLQVGSYEVAVELKGFKRFVQRPVVLEVDQTARIDTRLQTGAVTESVTVTGGAPLVDTDRSDIGGVVENRTIVELPLNGRNFIRLGSLMPGTTRGAPGNSVVRDRQEGEALTANGQRAEFNNYILDGADNNSTITGIAVVVPSIDAIQEFKVQTSNYSAEFGRAAGAVVNVAIKSGTNQLHGTVYEFLRNDKLDARGFFPPSKNPLRYNLFGVSAGGPVIRNRLFLFGNYEGNRERRTSTLSAQVPTEAMRRGDFSGQATIYDPLALDASGNRLPFADNIIPANRIDPVARKLLAIYPAPNFFGDPARNFVRQFSNPRDRDQFHLRGDYNLSSSDQIMARISWTKREDVNNTINYNGDLTRNDHQSGVAGWTHLFSSRFLNEVRFSATKYGFDFVPEGVGTDFAGALGLPKFGSREDFQRHPVVSVTNLASVGGNQSIPLYRHEYNYQWVDQATLTLGRHSLKMGFDIRRYGSNNVQPQNSSGFYSFTGAFTGQRGASYRNGLADLLLGLPANQRVLVTDFFDANRLRNTRTNLYVQDDINVSPSFTLNLGLRWERDGAWTEKDNRWAYFDYNSGQIVYPRSLRIPFTLLYPHRFDDIRNIKQPTNKAFAPRVGFAWRPFGNNRTVVRSAYGVFFNQPLGFIMLNTALTPPPFLLTQDFTSGTTTPELRFGVFPGVSPGTFVPRNPTLFTMDPNGFTNAYIQQWNFGVHREVLPDVALKVSYVGNKGTHLERRFESNAAPPGPGAVNGRRRYPEFRSIILQQSSSYSTYHALQVQGEKRYSRGLSFLTGYTWSKAIDDTSSWSGIGPGDNLPQDPRNIAAEKGRSAFDLTHRFTGAFVYNVPFRTDSRLLNLVTAGWQTNGILTLQTGFPTTVLVPGDIPNAAAGVTRANVSGDPRLPESERTIDRWFRTEAFSPPAAFTFGNSGRNILDGPGSLSLDFSLAKSFAITERQAIQFRGEAFNVLNHPVFGLPNTTFGNNAFGTIRGGGGGREIQLALKYVF